MWIQPQWWSSSSPSLLSSTFPLSLTVFDILIPLGPPLLHAYFSFSSAKSFSPFLHSTHFSNVTHWYTSISLKSVSDYLSISLSGTLLFHHCSPSYVFLFILSLPLSKLSHMDLIRETNTACKAKGFEVGCGGMFNLNPLCQLIFSA